MAKMLSHLFSSIRGSVGGITYFPNQYGAIIARARVSPVNPATLRQEQARDSVSEAVEHWKNISDTFRDGWRWYANNTPMQGAQGNYTIPGREMYVRSYSPYEYLASRGHVQPAWAPNAPHTPGLPEIGPITPVPLGLPGIGFQLEWTNWNAETFFMYAVVAGPFGTSRRRYKGPWLTELLTAGIDVATGLTNDVAFTIGEVGDIFFYKARIIGSTGSGVRLSVPSYGRVICTETGIDGTGSPSPRPRVKK